MASESLKRALADTLRQLGPKDLSMFCRQLRRKNLPHSFLIALKYERHPIQITHLMVSTFTEAGALSLAVDTLRQIDCHEEADRLAAKAAGGEVLKHDPRHTEHIVDKCKNQLIHTVSDVESILDELLTKGVIQQDSFDKISALPTAEDKMRELLDGHLKTVGDKDFFFSIIKKQLPEQQGPSSSTIFPQSGLPDQPSSQRHLDNVRIFKIHPPIKVTMRNTAIGSGIFSGGDWIKLEPEVNCVDTENAPTYSLQSEAGSFECSLSGLRWICKEKVSFKYHFGSWEEHMERLETMQYMPGGPLLDITVIAGKLDEVYLPHWICTEDNPTILGKFAVLHIDTYGDVVEQVSEVTPSHVKLSQPVFSPRGVLMRAGFPVKINCKVLIYKTNKAFLTLHVYLIPRDPALQETIKIKELSSGYKMIQKPYPAKSLKMRDRYVLTADVDSAEIYPERLKLVYEGSDPNFFEVFIENPDSNFQLTLRHGSVPVWTCVIRKDDYENTCAIQVMYEEELTRVRAKLVMRVSRELINQLLDDLLEDRVLNDGEKDMILQENSTRADKARCLIDMVKKKGCKASRKILSHLQSRDPMLYAELGLPSGLPV